MADRLTSLLIICLQVYGLVFGDYCRSDYKPSIPFCHIGSISGSTVYINGSSVQTKEDLVDRGCVCYLEQLGNKELIVDAKESCVYCGLQVRAGNDYLRSSYYASQAHGWLWIALNVTKVTMTLGLDGSTDRLNTAFCITIQAHRPDIPVVLNLTCEDLVTVNNTSSTASSTGPNLITSSPYMAPNTSKSQSPTSAVTAKPLTKFETTGTAESSAKNTNEVQEPNTTNPSKVVTITSAQNNEIIVAAAAGGFGVGVVVVIVIDVIIFICYKRRIKNKDMQRSSTDPPREYTELEFNSRGGLNNSHVYNSIDRQNTYVNDVQ